MSDLTTFVAGDTGLLEDEAYVNEGSVRDILGIGMRSVAPVTLDSAGL